MHIRRCLSLLGLLSCTAFAGRIIDIPPYATQFTHDFRIRTPAIPEGAYVGIRIQAKVRLVNISSTEQNGKLRLEMPNFDDTIRAGSSDAEFSRIVSLCADTDVTATSKGTFEVSYKLGPRQNKMLMVEALFHDGRYCDSAKGTKCFRSTGGTFNPKFTVTVDEDRGAILGTISYNFYNGGNSAGSDEKTCSGASYVAGYNGTLPGVATFATLAINGGRPF